MKLSPNGHRDGLSLLEVLVALAVIAIALFAIAATQVSAFTANIQAREIAMVRDIASEAVADVRAVVVGYAYQASGNWEDLLNASGGSVTCGPPSSAVLSQQQAASGPPTLASFSCGGGYPVVGTDGITYTLRWLLGAAGPAVDVLPGIDSPQLALMHILLRVDWQRRGVSRSMSFEDYVGCVDIDATLCPDGPAGG